MEAQLKPSDSSTSNSKKSQYSSSARKPFTAARSATKPTQDERRAKGQSLMDTYKRSSRDMEVMREKRLCIKCGEAGHMVANCKRRQPRASTEIEGLRMMNFTGDPDTGAHDDPVFNDADFEDDNPSDIDKDAEESENE